MLCDMVANLVLPLLYVVLDRGHQGRQGRLHRGYRPAFREALRLLARLSTQVIKMTDEPLELPQCLGWRCPRRRGMLDGTTGNTGGVHAIMLVALACTLPEGLDTSRIDHTDTVSSLIHIQRPVLTVRAGRFPDRMPLGHTWARQPRRQRVEPGRSILERVVPDLLPRASGHLEAVFGHIKAELC